jgi:D-alanyl-D-alanine endopeptidase (penicillin-binding protein 7)
MRVLTLKFTGFLAALSLLAAPFLSTAEATHFRQLEGAPQLRSAAALIVDQDGHVIYGKDVDSIRPIASITKLMTAAVILDAGLDLDEPITITQADRDLVQLTGSRLESGAVLSRKELIMLAIMSSENRAASALGRTWPDGRLGFVRAMNRKSAELGMTHTQFADPAGLEVGNVSTARDLALLVRAAHAYPLIRQASTTRQLEVRPYARRGPLRYGNTNRLLKNTSWDIGLSKTGYLNEAGRCLVMQARIEDEPVYIVLLDSFGKLTPFGDSNRLRQWMLANR